MRTDARSHSSVDRSANRGVGERRPVGAIEPVAASEVTFAETVDVVVVGLGVAGTCATITAAEAGRRRPRARARRRARAARRRCRAGSSTSAAAPRCRRRAATRTRPRTWSASCSPRAAPAPTPRRSHEYCARLGRHYHWLVDHGVPFKGQFNDEPNREPFDDSGLVFSGGEDSWPFTDVADPVPAWPPPAVPRHRRRLPDGVPRRGAGAHRGATTRTDVRVDRLVVTDDDAVVGVVARVDDEDRAIRARGGVVLAAGGFVYNDAMLAHYCPPALRPAPGVAGRPAPRRRARRPARPGRGRRAAQHGRGRVRAADRSAAPPRRARCS